MKVITRNQVKTALGITDSSLDSKIDSLLPVISSKVYKITKNRYNAPLLASVVSGSKILNVHESPIYFKKDRIVEEYMIPGQMVAGPGIDVDAYIDEVYYSGEVELEGSTWFAPVAVLSHSATETKTTDFFLGIEIAYHSIIAKALYWMMENQSVTLPSQSLKSKRVGPLAVTFADEEMDGRYGVPAWFVKGLPKFMRGFK